MDRFSESTLEVLRQILKRSRGVIVWFFRPADDIYESGQNGTWLNLELVENAASYDPTQFCSSWVLTGMLSPRLSLRQNPAIESADRQCPGLPEYDSHWEDHFV